MAKTIYIKGDIISNDSKWIYDYFGWDSTAPSDIIQVLNEVNGSEDIIIEMNSGGGSVMAAHEIYTAIVNYQGNIEIHVVAIAGSAASEILMACKNKISPVGVVMIHNSSSFASGDYREMDNTSQMLQTVNKSIRNAYKNKTGLTDDELKELMDNTTWMSAEEAVEKGFVDEIMFNDSQNADGLTNTARPNQIAFYNSVGQFSQNTIEKLRNALILSNQMPNGKNNEPDNQLINIADGQANILNKNNPEGGKTMTLEELMKEHPELENEINEIKVTAKAEGVSEERSRLQAIDNIANTIPKELVNKAKYEEVMNASDLALKFVTDSKAISDKYMEKAIEDSKDSNVENVISTPSDVDEDADEALMNIAVKAANSKRKVV